MRPFGMRILVAVSALITISASYFLPDSPWIFYIFKPATTILILCIALQAANSHYKIFIVVGLIFALMGDIFLMLPSDQFLAGLICFLLTHICYIIAFRSDSRFGHPLWPYFLFAVVGISIFLILSPGVQAKMEFPVAIYASALCLMAAQAFVRNLQKRSRDSLYAAAGAVLFFISDSVLAYDRFIFVYIASQAIILATYYAAQYLIALSCKRSAE
jgi:uncharacterized membrane protein YhhN